MRRLSARAVRGGKAGPREINNAGIGFPVVPFGAHGSMLAEPPRKLPLQTHFHPSQNFGPVQRISKSLLSAEACQRAVRVFNRGA